ncbi:hypothetical protein [Bradyrhizobium guangdongense]|uniref:hypothetical protein n=1 Tax=Bradyrhizobium guangdongense TaxID=1325090 RepID=UPI001643061A|nr:hypothetical protein [Bradyrhizobium guangdongense]
MLMSLFLPTGRSLDRLAGLIYQTDLSIANCGKSIVRRSILPSVSFTSALAQPAFAS